MRERMAVFWSYVTFFPCLYFALVEEAESSVRQQTDGILYQWWGVLMAWIAARFMVWLVSQVFEWNFLTYISSLVLLLGWLRQATRGLKFLLLNEG